MSNRRNILRLVAACMLLVISVCMAGCSDSYPGVSFMLGQRMAGAKYLEENEPKLQAMGEQLIDALTNKDIDALKKIMSPAAVATEDFEKGFEYSCSFFDEEIVSSEMGGSNYGGKGASITFGGTSFKLTTVNQNEIIVSFKCYYTHKESDNVGIYRIVVGTFDSPEPNNQIDSIRKRLGIFNPEWNDVENK